jgi:hypothetical protein
MGDEIATDSFAALAMTNSLLSLRVEQSVAKQSQSLNWKKIAHKF